MLGVLCVLSLSTSLVSATVPPSLDLFIVSDDSVKAYDAASLDGSPPAYYFTKASDPALATTWALYFKGGGWSYDEYESLERSRSELGSSKNLAPTFKFEAGPSSPIEEYNSLAGANRVVLWYTDGASFTGNREGDVHVPGTNETIRCRGFANLQAILRDLDIAHGMTRATKILVSGGSAGGLAAYLHSQYISDRYSHHAQVAAAPASGFFMDAPNAAGDYVYPVQMKYVFQFQNSTAGLNQRCVAAQTPGDEWKCILAQNSYAHTTVPTFIMNCPWDSWQEKCEFTSQFQTHTGDPVRSECAGLPGYESCGSDFHKCNGTQMEQFNQYA